MFNLEQAIGGWREQMRERGIGSPEPIEELEGHLREEIEQQLKLGLNEAGAFAVGAQKIGSGQMLQNEFSKVNDYQKILRPILLIIGWFVGGFMLFCGVMRGEMEWNFFSFHPKWGRDTILTFALIIGAETGIWFLAKASRDRTSRIISLLVCLCLVGQGYSVLPAEAQPHIIPASGSDGAIARLVLHALLYRDASPIWFRGGAAMLLSLPAILWIWHEWQRVKQKRETVEPGNQALSSN